MSRNSYVVTGLTCFLAAAMGTMVSLAFSVRYQLGWWPIIPGLLIFPTIAYFLEDIDAAWIGFKRAVRNVVEWRPDWEVWKLEAAIFFWVNLPIAIAGVVALSIAYFFDGLEGLWNIRPGEVAGKVTMLMAMAAVVAIAVPLILCSSDITEEGRETREHWVGRMHWEIQKMRSIMRFYNPMFWVHLIRAAAGDLAGRIIRVLFIALAVVTTTIVSTHTSQRLILMSGTAVGMLAGFASGYYHDSIFGGTLIGGMVGGFTGAISKKYFAEKLLKLRSI